MSGYVASARVRAAPRLANGDRAADRTLSASSLPVEPLIVEVDADRDSGIASALAGPLERARAFRERWAQLTFYLFDPNSWR